MPLDLPAIDAGALWTPPKPAIVRPAPVTETRFVVNDGKDWDCGACLPRDFMAMPKILRRAVPIGEIASFLPREYRRLPASLLWSLVAGNIPGLPGVLLSGGARIAWLYLASTSVTISSEWNSFDNIIHALGRGGSGKAPTESSLLPGDYYGGAGGGGAGWAALVNRVYQPLQEITINVATSSGDTWWQATDELLAPSGGDGGNVSGGSASGGAGGQKTAAVGDLKASGGDGAGISGPPTATSIGGRGGGAGGPHGDGAYNADANQGGIGGPSGSGSYLGWYDGQDGVDGPAGGWNPYGTPNAGSGGGGGPGNGGSGSGYEPNGHNGGDYGGGSGGGGVTTDPFQRVGGPGTPAQGCILAINNASA